MTLRNVVGMVASLNYQVRQNLAKISARLSALADSMSESLLPYECLVRHPLRTIGSYITICRTKSYPILSMILFPIVKDIGIPVVDHVSSLLAALLLSIFVVLLLRFFSLCNVKGGLEA